MKPFGYWRGYAIEHETELNARMFSGKFYFQHVDLCPPEDFRFGNRDTLRECIDEINDREDRARRRMAMQMRKQAESYLCGECGDTGKLPEQTWVQHGPRAYEVEQVECDRCPRCPECGVELRLHVQGEDCP